MRAILAVAAAPVCVLAAYPESAASTEYTKTLKWGKGIKANGATVASTEWTVKGVKCKADAKVDGAQYTPSGGNQITVALGDDVEPTDAAFPGDAAFWEGVFANRNCACDSKNSGPFVALTKTMAVTNDGWTPCSADNSAQTATTCKAASGGQFELYDATAKECYGCAYAAADAFHPSCPAATPECTKESNKCKEHADATTAAECKLWSDNGSGAVGAIDDKKCKCPTGTVFVAEKGKTKANNCAAATTTTTTASTTASAFTKEVTVGLGCKGDGMTVDKCCTAAKKVTKIGDTAVTAGKCEKKARELEELRNLGDASVDVKITYTGGFATKADAEKAFGTDMAALKTLIETAVKAADGAITWTVATPTVSAVKDNSKKPDTPATTTVGSAMGQSGLVALFLMAGAATFF